MLECLLFRTTIILSILVLLSRSQEEKFWWASLVTTMHVFHGLFTKLGGAYTGTPRILTIWTGVRSSCFSLRETLLNSR